MKKKTAILLTACIIVIIGTAILLKPNTSKKNIWDTNAENLINSLKVISGDTDIEDLSKITPFKWDTLYSFAPYTSIDEIYKIVGYKWANISDTVSEGMNQIVFTKNHKVVCYIYGYPEKVKVAFDFGKYSGSHIKFTSDEKLSFKTTVIKNGIRYFILGHVKE